MDIYECARVCTTFIPLDVVICFDVFRRLPGVCVCMCARYILTIGQQSHHVFWPSERGKGERESERLELCYVAAIKLNHSLQYKSIDDLCQFPFINADLE